MKSLPSIAGILNLSPESFSDGVLSAQRELFLARARSLVADGATIIELGAVATSQGTTPIPERREIERLHPLMIDLASEVPFSVDTYRASVAQIAIQHGATMINDTSALRADPALVNVIAETGVSIVLMYAKDGPYPHVTDFEPKYGCIFEVIEKFLENRVEYALKNGVKREQIILDPGMGKFLSHDPDRSWEVLRGLDRIRRHFPEFPLFVSVSRKSFLGVEMKDRDRLSAYLSILAADQGVEFLRLHNVRLFWELWAARQKAMGR